MKRFKTLMWVICLLLVVAGCEQIEAADKPLDNTVKTVKTVGDTTFSMHFIDVGQGDSILIEQGSHRMLVDAGDRDAADEVVDYLAENGVTTLDYVVATHPHADHIGGMSAVLSTYDADTVIMPPVAQTTKTFERLLDVIEQKTLDVVAPKVGDTYPLGDASFVILAPNGDAYDDLNNFSVVIKVTYGTQDFILTGDAEAASETEMIEKGLDLDAEVLKVGHHGSHSSTTPDFLKAVSPDIAVIQLGEDNRYGHPHKEITERLAGIDVYRNDLNGTVIIDSDGEALEVRTVKGTVQAKKEPTKTAHVYIGNKNSKVYHLDSCTSLPASHNQILLDSKAAAEAEGYKACSRCNP